MKWDTVPLNFFRNSLKTQGDDTKQVGHFFNSTPLCHRVPLANTGGSNRQSE